ncbi:MAG: hypothetical protein R2911_27850 [Caldilineaceae bacterium]
MAKSHYFLFSLLLSGLLALVYFVRPLSGIENEAKPPAVVLPVEQSSAIIAENVHSLAPLTSNSESPIIASLTWEPAEQVIRLGQDSDNYPLTWAADGHLYTAYGDGHGFDPPVEKKLSMGFARIEGSPPNISAFNIRSANEVVGEGRKFMKSAGLLAIDGIIYMWVRNLDDVGNYCRLAWSEDNMVTWSYSSWLFEQFGFCTFINYGQNYAGALDDYVYMVSHDHPSAYKTAERFVLARVHRSQIRDRNAYEFFKRVESDGTPQWSTNVLARGSILNSPGAQARRGAITYNAAIGRYIWWQGIPNTEDVRFSGGIRIYDAAEPWGPWSLVYNASLWDIGPGDLGNFPSKWISNDGLTMYLAFSGDDKFSVRKATLALYATPTPSATSTPVNTPTPTNTATSTNTPTPSNTPTSTSTTTSTPTGTATSTTTVTSTPTETRTPTVTPTETSTLTAAELLTPRPTSTPTFTPTPTETSTPSVTPTPTQFVVSSYDTDNDGIFDYYEDYDADGNLNNDDTDSDGIPNFKDNDDDEDRFPTIEEKADPNINGSPEDATDTDQDGIPDFLDNDDDGDGAPSSQEGLRDLNNNGIPDYLDPQVADADFLPISMYTEATATPTAPPTSSLEIVEIPIRQYTDDAEEQLGGAVTLKDPEIELGAERVPQHAGFRFQGLELPPGATIVNAYIRFTADDFAYEPAHFTIYGEAVANPERFKEAKLNISRRPSTNAVVDWPNLSDWAKKEKYLTPDLAPIVQEIVNLPDWESGNSMAFIITGEGTRIVKAYDLDVDYVAVLHIEYLP